MILPGPWVALVLALAAFRLLRLAGWDDFPPVYRVRAWLIGEHWVTETVEVDLPGKQPSSEAAGVRPAYRRPLFAHFVHCPFCIGFWISAAVYTAWVFAPTETLYAAAPFALSGTIGLIAKNLDR